jgi:hypothetical protein
MAGPYVRRAAPAGSHTAFGYLRRPTMAAATCRDRMPRRITVDAEDWGVDVHVDVSAGVGSASAHACGLFGGHDPLGPAGAVVGEHEPGLEGPAAVVGADADQVRQAAAVGGGAGRPGQAG